MKSTIINIRTGQLVSTVINQSVGCLWLQWTVPVQPMCCRVEVVAVSFSDGRPLARTLMRNVATNVTERRQSELL